MTLTTHAVAGAAVAALAANNIAFAAGAAFMSHFLLDSIPHWDYFLASVKQDRANPLNNDMKLGGRTFFIDILKILLDCLIALAIICFLFLLLPKLLSVTLPGNVVLAAFVGAAFGMAPDALQFVYWKFRHEPIISLQKFHIFIASEHMIDDRPAFGIACQALVILVAAFVTVHFIL